METLIVSGGEIDLAFLQNYLAKHQNQVIIAVDKGLEALHQLNILPHHIVGDLDSTDCSILKFYQNHPQITVHQYRPEKDFTDTDIALNLAISLQSSKITSLGALGKRFDHALANIHILTNALNAGISCEILDPHNRIYLKNKDFILKKSKLYGRYISFIPLTSSVKHLSLTGFRYPLEDYELSIGKSLGVSNEVVENVANVTFLDGILIVVESKDCA